jgi:hypothetical protein
MKRPVPYTEAVFGQMRGFPDGIREGRGKKVELLKPARDMSPICCQTTMSFHQDLHFLN